VLSPAAIGGPSVLFIVAAVMPISNRDGSWGFSLITGLVGVVILLTARAPAS
jgi:hypothetical protein